MTRSGRAGITPRGDPLFARVLERHRALHDLSKPLVRADYAHALDTWCWLRRLEPNAPRDLQWAALLHDIERLDSEADVRVEQHAASYEKFKAAHAALGATKAYLFLVEVGAPDAEACRVSHLVALHERPTHTALARESQLLADADSLSFFSLNSPGFLNYFGTVHTLRKLDYTLTRMSARARDQLAGVKLRPDIEFLLDALCRKR